MINDGQRMEKPSVLKMIGGVKCDVKEGWSPSEPHMEKIDDDTYVLIYKSAMDGTCTSNGKTEKQPSPTRAATLWVRNGEKWQAAFHGENPIVEPKELAAAGMGGPAGLAKPAGDTGTDGIDGGREIRLGGVEGEGR